MKTSTKIALAVALMGTLGLAGLAKNGYARSSESAVAVMPQQQNHTQVAEAAGGDGDGETNDDVQEQEESTHLQSLAKITPQQARAAAETAVGATASSVKLENEDGNLVYAVVIGQKEVTVDAGNGKVLSLNDSKTEGNERVHPRSSIQVSEGADGDGDGETNDDG